MIEESFKLFLLLGEGPPGYTYDELEKKLGQSRRTIIRYKSAIHMAGLDINSRQDGGGPARFWISSESRSHLIKITAEELVELELSESVLRKSGFIERANTLRNLIAKLPQSATRGSRVRAGPDIEALLLVEGIASRPGPWLQIQDTIIAVLRDSILKLKMLKILYAAPNKNERQFLVEPYGILYGEYPYLLAFRPEKNKPDLGLYRLDRIKSVEKTDHTFEYRHECDVDTIMKNSFGVFREEPFHVTLRFSGPRSQEAQAWRFHQTQEIEYQEDGRVLVRFFAGGLEEMALHLVRFGADVEVLEPLKLRQRLAAMGETLFRRHGPSSGST